MRRVRSLLIIMGIVVILSGCSEPEVVVTEEPSESPIVSEVPVEIPEVSESPVVDTGPIRLVLPEIVGEDATYVDDLSVGLWRLSGELNRYLIAARTGTSRSTDGVLGAINTITILPRSETLDPIASAINLTLLKLGGAVVEFERQLSSGGNLAEAKRVLIAINAELDSLRIMLEEGGA